MIDTSHTPKNETGKDKPAQSPQTPAQSPAQNNEAPKEIGGRGGLDPVRYGDWEIGGKCVDF
jgi:hypothetical protein